MVSSTLVDRTVHPVLLQEDPKLEKHFQSHRSTVTSLSFAPSAKQLGKPKTLPSRQ